jgi:hypothetical protein
MSRAMLVQLDWRMACGYGWTVKLVEGPPVRGETLACARCPPTTAASALAAAAVTNAADNIAITSRLMTPASIRPRTRSDRYI